jgi:hypothetical protein
MQVTAAGIGAFGERLHDRPFARRRQVTDANTLPATLDRPSPSDRL